MSLASVALSPMIEESLHFPEIFTHQHGISMSDPILVFLSVGGSMIPMHVMESDSIASVKLRIQSFKGFFVKKQKLVFEGRELARSNSLVRDYGLADGNVLHLLLRLSDLQAIKVTTACGKVFDFQVERSRNVGFVKQQLAKKGKGLVDLKNQRLICDGEELEDQKLVTDLCKTGDVVVHLLVRKSVKVRAKPVEKQFEVSIDVGAKPVAKEFEDSINDLTLNEKGDGLAGRYQLGSLFSKSVAREPLLRNILLEPIVVNSNIELPMVVKKLISSTFDGLEKGNDPIRSMEGSGGAYFMQDSSGQNYISVFKPVDEEPMAVNNPRGLPLSLDGEGLKKGTRVGEGAIREVAAYILDQPRGTLHSFYNGEGFAGVPPTVMVKCLHKGFNHPEGYSNAHKNVKIGSLQMFMNNVGSCEDMGPRAFPVDEVHKISVLDIRLANTDRHAGNILVNKDHEDGHIRLIPIDHGYCLPDHVSALSLLFVL